MRTSADPKRNKVHYGRIVHQGEVLDEVLLTVFRAPKTFTAEDVVEIMRARRNLRRDAHFGSARRRRRQARFVSRRVHTPGAYLNGRNRPDAGRSDPRRHHGEVFLPARRSPNRPLSGTLKTADRSDAIRSPRTLIAAIEVHIDYPEYDDAETLTTRACARPSDPLESGDRPGDPNRPRPARSCAKASKTVIVGTPNVQGESRRSSTRF
ncbi:MAG: hypothetical protein MZU84_07250 [Sphingobacterium sp.]|nr:hypothetical protein [Sphingobacterium sp.]